MKRVSKITTETNCIHLDNTLLPKGSMTVLKQTDGVILNYIAKTGYIYILAKGTTIDGEEFDLDFLFNFFINNGFSNFRPYMVVNQNGTNNFLGFWTGTQAEYDAIETKLDNRLYVVKG